MEEMEINLQQQLQETKTKFDAAYETTKNKYNEEQATAAIANLYLCGNSTFFTKENNARSYIKSLTYKPYELQHILLDYAVSSFLLNNMECDMSLKDIIKYTDDPEGKLDYSGSKAIKVIALGTAYSPYWVINLMAINKKLTFELVLNFIEERYVRNRKQELDNCEPSKFIRLEGIKHGVFVSKYQLNNHMRNIKQDAAIEELPLHRNNSHH